MVQRLAREELVDGPSQTQVRVASENTQGRRIVEPGTEIAMIVEGFSLRLVRAVPGPELVRRGSRLVARPRVPESERPQIDLASLIDEERDRWPD